MLKCRAYSFMSLDFISLHQTLLHARKVSANIIFQSWHVLIWISNRCSTKTGYVLGDVVFINHPKYICEDDLYQQMCESMILIFGMAIECILKVYNLSNIATSLYMQYNLFSTYHYGYRVDPRCCSKRCFPPGLNNNRDWLVDPYIHIL